MGPGHAHVLGLPAPRTPGLRCTPLPCLSTPLMRSIGGAGLGPQQGPRHPQSPVPQPSTQHAARVGAPCPHLTSSPCQQVTVVAGWDAEEHAHSSSALRDIRKHLLAGLVGVQSAVAAVGTSPGCPPEH